MLTAHHRAVAGIVCRRIRDVTGREDIRVSDHLEVPVDIKAPEGAL